MNKDLILEIGVEELPVEFISQGLKQLAVLAESYLNKEKIKFKEVSVYGTPCRLILSVTDLEERQTCQIKEIRGPAKESAFDNQDKATAQLIGFSKAQKMNPSDLVVKKVGEKDYIFAVHKIKGKETKKILSDILPRIIADLSFPKMMRWDSEALSFARPIKWILALLDKEIVRFNFKGILSSNESFGNKYLFPKRFKVKDTANFSLELRKKGCVISITERVEIIKSEGAKLAKKVDGQIYAGEDTLEEVANFVEWPLTLLGKFHPQFLKIPQEILIEVIIRQEKCLPIGDKKGKLQPYFLVVANRKKDIGGLIRKGYERVMEARFKDAEFLKNAGVFAAQLSMKVFEGEMVEMHICDKWFRTQKVVGFQMEESPNR